MPRSWANVVGSALRECLQLASGGSCSFLYLRLPAAKARVQKSALFESVHDEMQGAHSVWELNKASNSERACSRLELGEETVGAMD
jgi:hypothetical protein